MQFSPVRILLLATIVCFGIAAPVRAEPDSPSQDQGANSSINALVIIREPSTMWASIAVTVGLFLYGARPWQRRRELR
jgi:amino acid transporter